jgi:TonB family protein
VSVATQKRNVTAKGMRHVAIVGLVAWLSLLSSGVQAQDALARAKDLYLSADYDEALVLLEQLKLQPAPGPATEVEQYRVFCLLALERSDEARKAIEGIITADPFYRPSEAQTSPRIRAVFQETRKALLPELVQRTYTEAKASFERKDPKALSQFEQVLALLDDPDLKGVSQLADLRTVVEGFRDLSKAIASVKPPDPPTPVETAIVPTNRAPATASSIADAPDHAVDNASGFTPPIVISQPIPSWTPPNNVDRRSIFKGLIEVTIDENGGVTAATLQQSVHPLYDEKLLAMARTWKYKPAMRNGVPTSAVKVVEIRLQPSK